MVSEAGELGRPAGGADIAEVFAAVERNYGFRVRNPKLYKGEYDSNIRFDDPEHGLLLAKVSAPDLGAEAVRWQETVLDAATRSSEVNFRTPTVMLTSDGRKHVRTDRFLVRVVTWISGNLMNERDTSGDIDLSLLRSLGEASARLTRALSTVRMPPQIAQHEWMLHRGPQEVRHSLAALEDSQKSQPGVAAESQIRTIRAIADRFEQEILPRLDDLPWAVVHHDLHDANVVLDRTGTEVAGVIDFNDAVHAPRISDLAISAAYAMLRQNDPERAFGAVIDGYRSIIEPTAPELELVGELSLMRLCMNWAQWQSRALESADNEYALNRSKFTWPLIEHLAEKGAPAV